MKPETAYYTPLEPADRLLLQHAARFRAVAQWRQRYRAERTPQVRRNLLAALRAYRRLVVAYLDA